MAQNRGLWQTIVDGLIASEGAMGLNRWIDMLTGTLPLKLLFVCSLLVGYGERLSLYMSQMTHSAEAYSSFHSMKQLQALILPPWDASPTWGYPPVFHQASLTIFQCSINYTPG